MAEGRHPGKSDAVCHFPIRLSGLVIAYPNYISLGMLLPKLRRHRIHKLRKWNIVAWRPMAGGALLPIHPCPTLVDVLSDTKWGLLHLALDARIQGDF